MSAILSNPSPNFGPRRHGARPDMVVLHYTAFSSAQEALDRLCDPKHEVSSHYLIGRCGTCWHLVDEAERAWHAGAGSWGGRGDVNSHSIGIELDNDGISPFSEPLMQALERLLPKILSCWSIPCHRVIGHSDMAPDRKIDPGARFDWRRLSLLGLTCWPQASAGTEGAVAPEAPAATAARGGAPAPDPAAFHADLIAFGYPSGISADACLASFRLRFRPWARGPLDAIDAALARDLALRFPVDAPDPTA